MTAAPVGSEWRKSSYSGSTGGECVEVGILTVSPEAYAVFVAYVSA
ncbi:DUF397 domain-containing protein [Streptomyces coeruleorubidus]